MVTLPSVVLPGFVGAAYDYFPGPLVVICALVVTFMGQACLFGACIAPGLDTVDSALPSRLHLALTSAAIFGAGAGAIDTLQHAAMASLLKNRNLGLGMGLTVCATNLWRLLANETLPSLGERFGLIAPLSVVVGVCAASLAAGISWAIITRSDEDRVGRPNRVQSSPTALMNSGMLRQPARRGCIQVPRCSLEIWLIWLLHMLLMATSVGFSNIATVYLTNRGGDAFNNAAASMELATSLRPATLVGACFSGVVADYMGRGRMVVFTTGTLVAAVALLGAPWAWPFVSPSVSLALLGFAQGSLTTLLLAWLPQFTSGGKLTGFGYGMMESLAALGEFIGNLAIGAATAQWGLLHGAMPLFLSGAILSFALAAFLMYREPRDNSELQPGLTVMAEPLLQSA